MGLTVRLGMEFDTMGCEPNPWWKPFVWYRAYNDDNGHWLRVVRIGVLGVHLAGSIAYSPAHVLEPKE